MFIKLLLNPHRNLIKIQRRGGQEHPNAIMVARGTPMAFLISEIRISLKYYERLIKVVFKSY